MLNIYSFAALLSFTAGASEGMKKKRLKNKSAGLWRLVQQSVGLDGIRQLLRIC